MSELNRSPVNVTLKFVEYNNLDVVMMPQNTVEVSGQNPPYKKATPPYGGVAYNHFAICERSKALNVHPNIDTMMEDSLLRSCAIKRFSKPFAVESLHKRRTSASDFTMAFNLVGDRP